MSPGLAMTVVRALLVAVAALGTVRPSAGLICLPQPRNLSIEVININITLKWEWDNPCNLSVTFSVQIQSLPDDSQINEESSEVVSVCQDVTINECDLSSAVTEYYDYYMVSVRVDTTTGHSPWASITFCPDMEAQIGPPGVKFEFIYGDMKISIISPEANQPRKMWKSKHFNYKLVIWKNSSHPEERKEDVFSGQFIYDLEPETIYCLKVKARNTDHRSLYSRVYCTQTPKAWIGLPRPENLCVHGLNMKFISYWDHLYDGNVSFLVQYFNGHKTRSSPDISKEWHSIEGCKNISTTHCALPSSSIGKTGIYYLRVQALYRDLKSPWSKMLKFEPQEVNELGPPGVKVEADVDSLLIFITSPGESENNSMSRHYQLTYYVWYWANSAHPKKREVDVKPYKISGLTPSTLYCLKVQAHALMFNKYSNFSNVACIETRKGKYLNYFEGCIIVAVVMIVISGLIYALYHAWRQIKYAFFPKCTPPMIIENFEGRDVNSSYLLTSEELTENCVIVDSIPSEVNLVECKAHSELEQSNRDSGNYSNDCDSSGNRELHMSIEPETV
ncbi:interferon alpha/beta receptor 1 isoform X1 [Varanus komodoensis]|uniref:Interferon alpha and beta receptor subunit 1 n=2 Tax=Varanus komodoensis TaxID=61221 RepID=A0A8D2J544_VARKO|nr:interferon alpha/beta receptor 1 isoform X1 [Varanus komodoensis]